MGRASALRFVQEGAAVVIADINEAGGEAVVRECRQAGGKAVFQRTNVAVEADVKAVVARAVGEFGRLDIMFNSTTRSNPISAISRPFRWKSGMMYSPYAHAACSWESSTPSRNCASPAAGR